MSKPGSGLAFAVYSPNEGGSYSGFKFKVEEDGDAIVSGDLTVGGIAKVGWHGYERIIIKPTDFVWDGSDCTEDHDPVRDWLDPNVFNAGGAIGSESYYTCRLMAQYVIPNGYKATGMRINGVNHDGNDVFAYSNLITTNTGSQLVNGNTNTFLVFSPHVEGTADTYITVRVDDFGNPVIHGGYIQLEKI
ncbi:hypothetical protein ISS05_04440 [Candidatus Woesearchaeota archaeon]|nr:hypothetical protein [Candidatus Woesearchaeota archaeon]